MVTPLSVMFKKNAHSLTATCQLITLIISDSIRFKKNASSFIVFFYQALPKEEHIRKLKA